ncbi:hypothetical protein F4861DRAFT_461 [Xylaria intraflava]|nr:hypothetical protein F4861DRAFT_461 [Xylaria intraflava]
MSVTDTCILCGGDIGYLQQSPSWMNEFRAVYAIGETEASASLSGLEERYQFRYVISIASPDGQESRVNISLMRTFFVVFGSSDQYRTVWGFALHCSCWELLKASSTGDIHVQSLFDLCRSFPITMGLALDFGHTYGGLYLRRRPGIYLPFRGDEMELNFKKHDTDNAIFQCHTADPLDTSFLTGIIQDQEPSRESLASPTVVRETVTGYDPFGKLPVEVLQYILPCLSSLDVLNLKLSSRVIANTPLHDRFWHSRFCRGGEFDYMFEFAPYSKHRGQWEQAFLFVWRLRRHPSLMNRKRIWGLANTLHNLLSQTGTCHGSALRSWFERDAPLDSRTWVTASRDLKLCSDIFNRGSRSLYDRFLVLPEVLSSISVSMADLPTGRYVSGMRIEDMNGNRWDLGYFEPGGSITVATTCILGFLLAEDRRGIRGMRVLSEGVPASEWIGEHRDIARRRLVLPKTIPWGESSVKYIKGGFDACKMVSLAISGRAGSAESSDDLAHPLCLQDAAIWFPDVPGPEFSFFGVSEAQPSDPDWAGPLQASMFSDSTGSHLPHVIGIKVWTNDYNHLLSLRVDLDEPLDGRTRIYLGTEEGILERIKRDIPVREHSFAISSAEGERIVGLNVHYLHKRNFLGLEVHTNRNRVAQLPRRPTRGVHRDDWKVERLWPETGQIVGFYGVVNSRLGVASLGIVCGGATLRQFPIDDRPDGPVRCMCL